MSCQNACPFENIIDCAKSKCQNCKWWPLNKLDCQSCIKSKCSEFGPLQDCALCGIFNDPNFDINMCTDSITKEDCQSVGINCCKWTDDNKLSTGSVIGIVVGSTLALGLLGMILYYYMRKRKR